MKLENPHRKSRPVDAGFRITADRPMALLAMCPAYAATPLVDAHALAERLGLTQLWIKDETSRMRLGSFKALGGAFAVAQIVIDKSGETDPTVARAKAVSGDLTIITASAGNHGLSVAAGARVFGTQAKIALSSSVPESFADRIRATGAGVVRVNGTYEDSVAEAARLARENGWIHLADGSWEGYTEAPALVMEGYTVLAEECRQTFAASGVWPTHVYLQAGVGGLAAGVAAHIRTFWAEQPQIIVVEPDAAPCLLKSAKAGALTNAPGPDSNMGRLDCKDASLLAFQVLRTAADRFVTVSDAQALAAVDQMAGTGVVSTPSGTAGLAALIDDLPGADARVLLIASEGAETG